MINIETLSNSKKLLEATKDLRIEFKVILYKPS